MYGIIHNAVRSTVLLHADEAVWSDILTQAELTDQHFLSPANYSDAITFGLIDAVAAALTLSRAEVLCLAGRHWCDFSIGAGYGSLFSMAGQNLGDFLANLDRMHNSLNVALVEASMPTFELTRSDTQGFEIIYRSQREGLAPFVEGILHGLFRHYGEPMTMQWEEKDDGAYFTLDRIHHEVGVSPADDAIAKTAFLTDRTAA